MTDLDARLERMDGIAHALDEAVELPIVDYRVGLDGIVGLLPVAGDWLMSLCSLYLLVEAARLGIGKLTLLRMAGNVLVDAVLGSVPLLGDLFDVVWKANVKNVELARRDLQ